MHESFSWSVLWIQLQTLFKHMVRYLPLSLNVLSESLSKSHVELPLIASDVSPHCLELRIFSQKVKGSGDSFKYFCVNVVLCFLSISFLIVSCQSLGCSVPLDFLKEIQIEVHCEESHRYIRSLHCHNVNASKQRLELFGTQIIDAS